MSSVYVPPAAGGGSSTASGSDNAQVEYNYLAGYFNAHMLSKPSWRYFYWLQFVLLALVLLAAALRAAFAGRATWLGAWWNKVAVKHRTIKIGRKEEQPQQQQQQQSSAYAPREMPGDVGSDDMSHLHGHGRGHGHARDYSSSASTYVPRPHPHAHAHPHPHGAGGFSSGGGGASGPRKRRMIYLPSIGRMLLLVLLLATPIALSLIGADYIAPSAGVFDVAQSFPNGSVTPSNIETPLNYNYRRRGLVQWGLGAYPKVGTVAIPNTIPYRTWWTIGGRLGGMTSALTPFVLVLALRQRPFALLANRALGGWAFERLSFLHKWAGRIVWLFATAHVVTWSVQLGEDRALGGRMIWSFVFRWPRFRWGFVVSFAMYRLMAEIADIRFLQAHTLSLAPFPPTRLRLRRTSRRISFSRRSWASPSARCGGSTTRSST